MTGKRLRAAGFFFPVFLTMIIMAACSVFPFGDNTFLIWDMDWQYSSFFVRLHDILHGDASAWYSFSRAIGGDMAGVAAYYLISPFNLLFYFFDEQTIYAGICLVLLLKIGMIGFCMNIYLCAKKESAGNLLFSAAYALCGFLTAYFFNIIWLDGIMFLPLLVLGIERLVEKQKYLLYTLVLGISVAASFYIGYMLCIFSVLYFICYFFLLSKQKKSVRTIFIYAGSSLCAGMLSAVCALGALYSMQDGKSSMDFKVLKNFSPMFSVSNFFSKSFAGTIDSFQITGGSPLLYCGVLTLLFVWAFFLQKQISRKKKAAYGLLAVFLLASLYFYNLCCAWQAFQMPNGSQYRYAFLYAFVMLVIGAESYWNYEQNGWDSTHKKLFFGAGIFLCVQMILVREDFAVLERKYVFAFNLILIAVYLLISLFIKNKTMMTGLFLLGMSAELTANALFLYKNSPLYQSETVSDYKNYVDSVSGLAQTVKQENGLFRTVLSGDAYRTVNDSFLFQLYGLDSYTSVERRSTQDLAFNLGYYQNMIFGIHYNGGTTHAAESFLGVKYLITSEEPENGYQKIGQNGTIALYENQTALPIAFFAESGITEVNNEDYNCFEYQNNIYKNLSSELSEPIFAQADWKLIDYDNCIPQEDGSFLVEDTDLESYAEYELEIKEEGRYYVQYLGSQLNCIHLILNGEEEKLEEQQNVVKRLGYLKKTDKVVLRCFVNGGTEQFLLEKVYPAFERENVLASYANEVQMQKTEIEFESEDNFRILCENTGNETKYLVCTIPYDAGWSVFIDGVQTTPLTVLGNYMMFEIEPGEHILQFRFLPQGIIAGSIISLSAAALLIVLQILHRRNQKIEK